MTQLKVKNQEFWHGDKPMQIVSGAIHYFRIVPEYWKDRLLKLKACGFNTVETYIAWNVHEPKEGQFCFEGMANVVEFIKTAEEVGLFVIVRPSPYICAEWEFGGLPAWLLADDSTRLRSSCPQYLEKIDNYYDVLMEKLKPLLSTNGGPIIAMQIENEYGSYGNDTKYLEYLRDGLTSRGIDVLLFTSDGPEGFMLQGGMVPGVLETVNFGSKPKESFAKLEEYQKDQPLMCMEYWNGWFDHWGEEHHTRDPQDAVDSFETILKEGASVNFYMFHGGTNFGFYNGANYGGAYQPTVTSYDYDCPVSESGDLTTKYYKVRDVMTRHTGVTPPELPAPIPKKAYGAVHLTAQAGLFDSLNKIASPLQRTHPESMEKLGQNVGFTLYRTTIKGPREPARLAIQDVRDRALVFVNQAYIGVIDRINGGELDIEVGEDGAELDILVENMGRINYGPYLKDRKGITEGVRLGQQFLYNWTIYPLPLDDLTNLSFNTLSKKRGPSFYKASFGIDEAADTFLELPGWTKGAAFINGFNLGRYWEIGPQKTLYVPAPLLNKGKNKLVVFELHGMDKPEVIFQEKPDLG
ncbi:beta-galactosidase [Scopulibacillus darangshiensis]|uniref:beta-galactosidase n=1 Tax=Scopulibacillus darangshiensis TaxID=442528 RepID=A0A4R2NLM3_9BACL|nr:beta-galactosidase family protein [Scopulibacillus darangshiensis]TCP22342.1 beta-galactosidase [Scopulibacillus darangshiensis]